ncbi:MAG: alpha/beta hydrolase [bacterium]
MGEHVNTILLLHGWGSRAASWGRVKELLESNGYTVLVPDLPGFGDNPMPQEAWNVDNYVDWVNNFIDHAGAKRAYIMGHSFGGRIAIKMAVNYPEKIAGLILVSAAGIKPRKTIWHIVIYAIVKIVKAVFRFLFRFPLIKWFIEHVIDKKNELHFQELFYHIIVRRRDYIETKGIMRETFKKVIDEDLSRIIDKIIIPTHIVWGDKDKMTPVKDAYLLNEKVKLSSLTVLKGFGHALNFETPDLVAEEIITFLHHRKACL